MHLGSARQAGHFSFLPHVLRRTEFLLSTVITSSLTPGFAFLVYFLNPPLLGMNYPRKPLFQAPLSGGPRLSHRAL